MFAYLLYNAGSYFARVLPWNLPEAIGWVIGQVSCVVRRGTRRNVEHNLEIIHGGALSRRQLRRRSRRVIMNFARAIVVFLRLPAYKWDELRKITDLSQFESAVENLGDRPVFLIASVHMGPWELGGLCLSRLGYRVHTVALDHPSEQVTKFFDRRRRSIGVINHPMGNSYSILKEALIGGDSVALLTDRAYGATHKRFPLFGVTEKFPLGHLYLSASCGVPILTGALVFANAGHFRYVHGGVHHPPPEGAEDVDKLEALQARVLADFETIIRDHSDQWFHFERLGEAGEPHQNGN
jgi:KDO2-lipid IV(A) lauroyltransferase